MKKLTAEKSREQFEEEMRSSFGTVVDLRICKNSDGDYMSFGTQVAWHIWQKALEIALPILEQQERGDGWIEWSGGEKPVSYDAKVNVKYRDGDMGLNHAHAYRWKHNGSPRDIIAYRVIQEQPTNQNGEQ